MLKKLQILLPLLIVFSIPLQAQHINFELTYQSFRPFVHFQLDFDNRSYHHDYESAYFKGYMDGVNDSYYYRHRFDDLVRDVQIYETGYRDGFRDRELLIRLRGRNWYHRHRFAYNDYYSPSYSVRIWLDGLSIAFLQAPAHRLPYRWKHRAHPHVKKYRGWIAKNRYKHNKYRGYKSAVKVGHRNNNRGKLYKRQALKTNNRFRNKSAYKKHQKKDRSNYRQNRGTRTYKGKSKRVERSKEKQRKVVGNNDRQRRKAVKEHKRTPRKRGTVKRSRGSKKEKSKRSRSRGNRNKDN